MAGVSGIDQLIHPDEAANRGVIRGRRWLFRAVMTLITGLLALTVADGFDVLDVVGPDEDTVHATGGGFELAVEHPSVIRPALAGVFRIAVHREGGFDEPVQIAVSRTYLESWDVNGTMPAPSGETALGPWIVWEFDPPPGDDLVITYEARFEPGVQQARDGEVAVLVDDEPVAQVSFTTRVMP